MRHIYDNIHTFAMIQIYANIQAFVMIQIYAKIQKKLRHTFAKGHKVSLRMCP